jgi:4-carboxymuconolactone decarboxylase
MGDAYVDRNISQSSTDFAKAGQRLATEGAWGTIWTRPGLSHQQRSLCNIAMLGVLGK